MLLSISIGAVVGVVALAARAHAFSGGTAVVIMVVLFLWALVVNMMLWRCPSCGGHLGKLYFGEKFQKYCPNCGIKLMEK